MEKLYNKYPKKTKQDHLDSEEQSKMIEQYLALFNEKSLKNLYRDLPNLGNARIMLLHHRIHGYFTEDTINQHYDTDNQTLAMLFFADTRNPEMRMYLRIKWNILGHVPQKYL